MINTIEQSDLPELVRRGQVTSSQYSKALELFRDPKFWNNWAMKALFTLAVGHILAGIIFFFAFNWNDLSSTQKFVLVQGGIVANFIAWIGLKLDSPPAQAFGIALTIFIGVSLAVFAQVYQTPAAIYTPFILWATLSFPFTLTSRSLAHWTVWLAICVFALTSYINVGVRDIHGDTAAVWSYLACSVGFAALFLIYDLWISKRFIWARADWFRLILLAIPIGFSFAAFSESLWNGPDFIWLVPCLLIGALTASLYKFAPSVSALALCSIGLAGYVAQLGFRLIVEINDIVPMFLFGFIWFVGITIALAKTFQHLVKRFGRPKAHAQDNRVEDTEAIRDMQRGVSISEFATSLDLDPTTLTTEIRSAKGAKHLPDYMVAVLAFSGLVSAIFSAGWLALILLLIFKIENEYAYMILGLFVWSAAIIVRRNRSQIFLRYFYNAFILGGGALAILAFGIKFSDRSVLGFCSVGIVFSLITILLVRDRIIEFLCALGMSTLIVFALFYYNVSLPMIYAMAIFTVAGLVLLTRPIANRLYDTTGAAFLIASPLLAIWTATISSYIFPEVENIGSINHYDWITKISCTIILSLGVTYLNHINRHKNKRGYTPPLMVLVPLILAISIMPIGSAAGLLMVLTGYILGLRTIAGIGILFQIYFLYMFYYDLSTTLLNKSILLTVTGIIYLLIWMWVRNRYAGELS